MGSIFDAMDANQRQELEALGWVRGDFFGSLRWKSPTGETLTEDEAFRWLEGHKRALGGLEQNVHISRGGKGGVDHG